MLLPSLVALRIRRREARLSQRSTLRTLLAAACEGACWGAAVWIKPFVLVPAIVCWLVSARFASQAGARRITIGLDAAGVVAGGALVGLLGILWLAHTAALSYFRDIVMNWNPEYAAHAYGLKRRVDMLLLSSRLNMPWILAHAAAAPAAFVLCARGSGRPAATSSLAGPLLGSFYWGWLLQAGVLQPRLHDYIVASMLLIAIPIAVVFGLGGLPSGLTRRVAIVVAVALIAFRHPVFRLDRLAFWPQAVTRGNTIALREGLSLMSLPNNHGLTNWADLTRVAEYLASRAARGHDVLCFNESTHPLYLMLDLDPPIRFVQSNLIVQVFRTHRLEVMQELRSARARFVVSDLSSILAAPDTPADALPAPWSERYPWNLPVVFRAGRYIVHEPAAPITQFWE
jgi:hypothetical protein